MTPKKTTLVGTDFEVVEKLSIFNSLGKTHYFLVLRDLSDTHFFKLCSVFIPRQSIEEFYNKFFLQVKMKTVVHKEVTRV